MIHTIAICGGSAADDLEILADQVDCILQVILNIAMLNMR